MPLENVSVTENAVSCERLRKSYGSVVAVDGLTLTVKRGECFGLLGPNGAGKTTTIEILEGLLMPDAGDVDVLGRRVGQDPSEVAHSVTTPPKVGRRPELPAWTDRNEGASVAGLPFRRS